MGDIRAFDAARFGENEKFKYCKNRFYLFDFYFLFNFNAGKRKALCLDFFPAPRMWDLFQAFLTIIQDFVGPDSEVSLLGV